MTAGKERIVENLKNTALRDAADDSVGRLTISRNYQADRVLGRGVTHSTGWF